MPDSVCMGTGLGQRPRHPSAPGQRPWELVGRTAREGPKCVGAGPGVRSMPRSGEVVIISFMSSASRSPAGRGRQGDGTFLRVLRASRGVSYGPREPVRSPVPGPRGEHLGVRARLPRQDLPLEPEPVRTPQPQWLIWLPGPASPPQPASLPGPPPALEGPQLCARRAVTAEPAVGLLVPWTSACPTPRPRLRPT